MFWITLPWVISAITGVTMWLAGNKSPWAWILGLGNQVLWVMMILHAELYGLLPTAAMMVIIYTRNFLKWRRE